MGLWGWMVQTLTGHCDEDRPAGPSGMDGQHVADDAAVATLEPPPELCSEVPDQAIECWWDPEAATLTEPAPIAAPELSAEARALQNILISQFDGHELNMPPLPHVADRVLRRLSNLNYDAVQVADEIAEDQVLAAAVIRMANSPLYAGVERATSLLPAISRLGSNAVRTLMMHQSVRAATFSRKGVDKVLADILWKRSLASACIIRGLSQFTGVDGEEAFLIGLLHDIGSVIVLREVQKQQTVLKYKIDIDTFEYFCDQCHQEFGELVAEDWNLPASLKDLIADHHKHPQSDDPLRTERLVIQLGDMINAMIGYGTPASYKLMGSRPVEELELAGRQGFQDFLEELPGIVELNVVSLSF